MELFQPKDLRGFMAKEVLQRHKEKPMSPPGQARTLLERKPKYIIFPNKSEIDNSDPSPKPVSPPMLGIPRQVERPKDQKRPTIQLLKVMKKCWDDDSMNDFSYAMTDGLLNGRNEGRDRSRMWGELAQVVYKMWPGLGGWIMRHVPWPAEYDNDYLKLTELVTKAGDGVYTCDPLLANKDSSLDRVGFYSS